MPKKNNRNSRKKTKADTQAFIEKALEPALAFEDKASMALNLADLTESTNKKAKIDQLQLALDAYRNMRRELDKLPKNVRNSETWKICSREVNQYLTSLPNQIEGLKK